MTGRLSPRRNRSGDFCCLAGGRLLPRRDEGYRLGSAETRGTFLIPVTENVRYQYTVRNLRIWGAMFPLVAFVGGKKVPSNASQLPAELKRTRKRRSRPGGGSSLWTSVRKGNETNVNKTLLPTLARAPRTVPYF